MSTEQPTNEAAIIDQLTAYLDGELNSQEITEVESMIASDGRYSKLLHQLQQSWDALDILPVASNQPDRSFTQSTMKLAVEDAKKMAIQSNRSVWAWPLRFLALLLIPSVASAGTFFASRYIQDLPNKTLNENLALIRDLDLYDCDPNLSVELLEKKSRQDAPFGILDEDPENRNTLETDQEFANRMPAWTNFEKARVQRNFDRFQKLDSKRIVRARRLKDAIDNHERPDDIRETLAQYHQWLGSLEDSYFAEVLDTAETGKKLIKINEITRARFNDSLGKSGLTQLPEEDEVHVQLGFLHWLTKDVNQRALRDMLSDDTNDMITFRSGELGWQGDDLLIFESGLRLRKISQDHPDEIDNLISPEDITMMWGLIPSQETKDNIDFVFSIDWLVNPEKSEAQLMSKWMLTVFESKYLNIKTVESKDVQEFYMKELTPKERDELDNEYPSDRKRLLEELFYERYPDRMR